MNKMKLSGGFTLFEMVAVVLMILIISAIVVPQFTDVSTSTQNAAMNANVNAVRSSYALSVAQNHTNPTLAALASSVTGAVGVGAGGTGVDVGDVDGNSSNEIVLTFTDSACTTATSAGTDVVACVSGFSN